MSARLVVVGGAPATGKTTLARLIARDLGAALLTKDEVKEALADTLGAGDRARSRDLGIATHAVLYAVARRALVSDATILETEWPADDTIFDLELGVPTIVADTKRTATGPISSGSSRSPGVAEAWRRGPRGPTLPVAEHSGSVTRGGLEAECFRAFFDDSPTRRKDIA